MRIKKIAIGNLREAFIEDRLKDGVNIIFSNDNNKGKTLLMQGAMYAIGKDPIFPESFNYREYYFYTKIEINGKEYEFLRKKNSIIIKSENTYQLCNSISEFKYFFDKEIYQLPRISEDGDERIVAPSLLYELFFLGQDKRNTSKLISAAQYDKDGFKNMLYSMMDIDNVVLDKFKERNLKEKKIEIESKIRSLKKKLQTLKANPKIAEYSSRNINREEYGKKKGIMESINSDIAKYRTEQTRENNRKIKLESLLFELNSLNRVIDTGKIKCANCGSDKIIFASANSEYNFEISNMHVKRRIIESIKEDIKIKEEIIEELASKINSEQEQLNKEIVETPPDYRDYMIFGEEIINDKQIEQEIWEANKKLEGILEELKKKNGEQAEKSEQQKSFMRNVIAGMNSIYNEIDENGVLVFSDIFTKGTETYSGSENQEFYFTKIVSLSKEMNHDFPIIVDSFRDGEIASSKEEKMLSIYKSLNKQVLLTATLKDEEYQAEKYRSDKKINVLDYSDFANSKILQTKYSDEFIKILNKFETILENI